MRFKPRVAYVPTQCSRCVEPISFARRLVPSLQFFYEAKTILRRSERESSDGEIGCRIEIGRAVEEIRGIEVVLFADAQCIGRVRLATNIIAGRDVQASAEESDVTEVVGGFELLQKSDDFLRQDVIVSLLGFRIPWRDTGDWLKGLVAFRQLTGRYWGGMFLYPFCMNDAYAAFRQNAAVEIG